MIIAVLHDLKPNEALRALRLRKGLKTGQAADLLGVSQPHYSNVENGRAHPGLQLAVAIEDEFGIPAKAWVEPKESAA